jgi:hypothetical protein
VGNFPTFLGFRPLGREDVRKFRTSFLLLPNLSDRFVADFHLLCERPIWDFFVLPQQPLHDRALLLAAQVAAMQVS